MAEFGALIFPTDYAMHPVELAKAIEERGLDSLFFPEHTHIPASRRSPYPAGGDLPKEYSHTYDPFVAFGACAGATERIKLGTGICLVVERDVLTLAKEIASIDRISGGRFMLGIGAGWNAEEMENHGVEYKHRWKVVREKILAMREIWTKDEAEFHGDHVDFSSTWQWPKPTQKPHPPIILGGAAGPKTMKDIIEYCDGFMPIAGRYDFGEQITTLKQMASDAGRDPESFDFGQFGTPPKAAIVDALIEAGCGRIVFALPPADADTVIPKLDQIAEFKDQYS